MRCDEALAPGFVPFVVTERQSVWLAASSRAARRLITAFRRPCAAATCRTRRASRCSSSRRASSSCRSFIAEPIVYERESRLRNLLTVCGCDFNAYWLGTFIADYGLALVPVVATWITMPGCRSSAIPPEGRLLRGPERGGPRRNGREDGEYWKWNRRTVRVLRRARRAILPVFALQLVGYAYVLSFLFPNGPAAIARLPIFFIVLLIVPPMLVLVLTVLLPERRRRARRLQVHLRRDRRAHGLGVGRPARRA